MKEGETYGTVNRRRKSDLVDTSGAHHPSLDDCHDDRQRCVASSHGSRRRISNRRHHKTQKQERRIAKQMRWALKGAHHG